MAHGIPTLGDIMSKSNVTDALPEKSLDIWIRYDGYRSLSVIVTPIVDQISVEGHANVAGLGDRHHHGDSASGDVVRHRVVHQLRAQVVKVVETRVNLKYKFVHSFSTSHVNDEPCMLPRKSR